MTKEWFERVCMSALGHRTSQEQTYDLARLVLQRGIPGDFVECGVYAGASCALMARALLDYCTERSYPWMGDSACDLRRESGLTMAIDEGRRVHLFDTFNGIPAPGPYDVELVANKGGESACSIEAVKANMQRWGIPEELLVYHEGDFSRTVTYFAGRALVFSKTQELRSIGKIALLRLDGDLYDSTRVPLEQLYLLVSPGGYVIVDDFNLSGCRKAVLEYFKESGPAPIAFRKPE